ncbi:hypothetical protein F5Y14DRAFT_453706 [Nemania sp. NC0429]|nr:hypothetical protein F5Y14DRAFT_453706 [Nemania sp. NC0429]
MVVLRNKPNEQHRTRETELRAALERQGNKTRPKKPTRATTENRDQNRDSPRRTRSWKHNKDVVKIERVPTPLAEKRNEEEFSWSVVVERELAVCAKRAEKTGRGGSEENDRADLLYPDAADRSYLRGRSRGKADKRKPAAAGAADDDDGSWRENASPPVKRRCLEEDVPLVIECWQ